MTTKESVEQLNSLIEHFNNGGNDFNATDIEAIQCLLKENQELKKQLTTYQILHRDCMVDNLKNIRKIEEMENQQKEFIEYLEDLIKQNETVVEVSKYGLPKNCSKLLIDFYKEILSKYKSIIGGKDAIK